MPFPNPSTLKSDIALALTFLAGLLTTLFGIHLNVSGATLVLNEVVDALMVIVPLVLAVVRDIQHLHLFAHVAVARARTTPPSLQVAPLAPPSAGV